MTKEQLAKLGITIEGETIGEEEAQKLIEQKFASLNGDIKKQKELLTARNGEIAEFKRKEQEKLTDDEKLKIHYEEIEKQNKELSRKISLNEKISDLMSIGYDKELATKYATAELDGKSTIEFQKAFMDAKLEAQKQELLKGGNDPKLNNPNGTIKTKEDFLKASYEDKLKFAEEHPAEFETFSKN